MNHANCGFCEETTECLWSSMIVHLLSKSLRNMWSFIKQVSKFCFRYKLLWTIGIRVIFMALLGKNQTPNLKLESYKQIQKSASSPGCIQLARKWLAACENSHQKCKKKFKSDFKYPMRLISIANDTQRLISLDCSHSRDIRYVALSHCWGRMQFLKTCASNINRHMNYGIPHSELPQTFRDASECLCTLIYSPFRKVDEQ